VSLVLKEKRQLEVFGNNLISSDAIVINEVVMTNGIVVLNLKRTYSYHWYDLRINGRLYQDIWTEEG
jgi:hypothetical protein